MPSSTERLSKLEAAVLVAVDEGAPGAVSVLKDLIRTRSGSGSEGTSSDLTSVVGKVFAAASRHGTAVESQPVAVNSENEIEVLSGRGCRAFVIEAHMDAVPEGAMQDWLDGNPYSAAEGWAEYIGDNRIAHTMGSARFEATIRSRMSKIWEKHRGSARRRILYGRGSFDLLQRRVLSAA